MEGVVRVGGDASRQVMLSGRPHPKSLSLRERDFPSSLSFVASRKPGFSLPLSLREGLPSPRRERGRGVRAEQAGICRAANHRAWRVRQISEGVCIRGGRFGKSPLQRIVGVGDLMNRNAADAVGATYHVARWPTTFVPAGCFGLLPSLPLLRIV